MGPSWNVIPKSVRYYNTVLVVSVGTDPMFAGDPDVFGAERKLPKEVVAMRDVAPSVNAQGTTRLVRLQVRLIRSRWRR